jgi:pilus assembly protein FimV
MDIGAMLDANTAEDWNGFNLSPEQQADISAEIPDDQADIWQAEAELPDISEEDWGEQPPVEEPITSDTQYMSIDELMQQAEVVEADGPDPDEEELDLDVGLNEFPDVIGEVNQYDVDLNAEASGKLDLAKIYIEMNDIEGAVRLLEESMLYGEEDIQQQARALIEKINQPD